MRGFPYIRNLKSETHRSTQPYLLPIPPPFPNFRGYFLLGDDATHFFQKYMGKSKHAVLNTEKVVHPTTIACKWWDTDQQLVAVRQACQALSAATGLDFHHSNIKNFDDVMPVSAAMKSKSDERLDVAVCRLEKEEDAAKRSEERLLDAAICRLEKEEDAAKRSEERLLDAAIRREEKEMKEGAAAVAAAAAAAAARGREKHARQRKKEQEENARQRKKEQEEQAPKA